jgi:LysM repeat protein
VNARRVAGCLLAVVALAGCGVPQQYTTVVVAPWNPVSTPWNSTLWGIATHYKVAGGYQTLAQINDISNPSLIRPGEQIKVPV